MFIYRMHANCMQKPFKGFWLQLRVPRLWRFNCFRNLVKGLGFRV